METIASSTPASYFRHGAPSLPSGSDPERDYTIPQLREEKLYAGSFVTRAYQEYARALRRIEVNLQAFKDAKRHTGMHGTDTSKARREMETQETRLIGEIRELVQKVIPNLLRVDSWRYSKDVLAIVANITSLIIAAIVSFSRGDSARAQEAQEATEADVRRLASQGYATAASALQVLQLAVYGILWTEFFVSTAEAVVEGDLARIYERTPAFFDFIKEPSQNVIPPILRIFGLVQSGLAVASRRRVPRRAPPLPSQQAGGAQASSLSQQAAQSTSVERYRRSDSPRGHETVPPALQAARSVAANATAAGQADALTELLNYTMPKLPDLHLDDASYRSQFQADLQQATAKRNQLAILMRRNSEDNRIKTKHDDLKKEIETRREIQKGISQARAQEMEERKAQKRTRTSTPGPGRR